MMQLSLKLGGRARDYRGSPPPLCAEVGGRVLPMLPLVGCLLLVGHLSSLEWLGEGQVPVVLLVLFAHAPLGQVLVALMARGGACGPLALA